MDRPGAAGVTPSSPQLKRQARDLILGRRRGCHCPKGDAGRADFTPQPEHPPAPGDRTGSNAVKRPNLVKRRSRHLNDKDHLAVALEVSVGRIAGLLTVLRPGRPR
jgi:hypothetical protein